MYKDILASLQRADWHLGRQRRHAAGEPAPSTRRSDVEEPDDEDRDHRDQERHPGQRNREFLAGLRVADADGAVEDSHHPDEEREHAGY